MTNTYFPIVGGIEQSIYSFSEEFKSLGHEVLIVTPVFEGMPTEEPGVIRIPAFQKVNGTIFSILIRNSSICNTYIFDRDKTIVAITRCSTFWFISIGIRCNPLGQRGSQNPITLTRSVGLQVSIQAIEIDTANFYTLAQ